MTDASIDERATGTAHRGFVFPEPGDTVATLAARLLPGDADPTMTLLSWNMHLVMRRMPIGPNGELLPTDIVYVEPPRP